MKKVLTYTKQHYLLGIKCSKSLYMHDHHPDLKKIDESTIALMENGTHFEKFAREKFFPNGIDILLGTKCVFDDYVQRTNLALQKDNSIIYQAAFKTSLNEIALIDVLQTTPQGHVITEFKMKTKLSDMEYYDAAYQYYCLVSSGQIVKQFSIAYINKDFVKDVNDESDFILFEDVTKVCQSLLKRVSSNIQKHKVVMRMNEIPESDIGHKCLDGCPFKDHCWSGMPTNSVFEIRSMKIQKKFGLYYKGISTMEDLIKIREVNTLTDNQIVQITCALNNHTVINHAAIAAWLKLLEEAPGVIYLDFETTNEYYPRFSGMKPFGQLVTQYSMHYQSKDGKISHYDFLADPFEDPREQFIKHLITDVFFYHQDCPIITYNKAFECTRLKQCIQDFPQYKKDIQNIIDRVIDLMDVFKDKTIYYSPLFHGSYSIKNVLPVLCPDMQNSYKELPINNGSKASDAYLRMTSLPKHERELLARQLKEYCCLDTLALLKIVEQLQNEMYEYNTKLLKPCSMSN